MARKHYLKLRRLIEDQELEQEELAELSGVKYRTLNKRLNAPEDNGSWHPKEITAICKVLHIPQEKIGEYFFPAVEKGESAFSLFTFRGLLLLCRLSAEWCAFAR